MSLQSTNELVSHMQVAEANSLLPLLQPDPTNTHRLRHGLLRVQLDVAVALEPPTVLPDWEPALEYRPLSATRSLLSLGTVLEERADHFLVGVKRDAGNVDRRFGQRGRRSFRGCSSATSGSAVAALALALRSLGGGLRLLLPLPLSLPLLLLLLLLSAHIFSGLAALLATYIRRLC